MRRGSNHVALDCGNSSFRTVLGTYDGEVLSTQTISQVSHDMVRVGNYYYWDMLRIFQHLKESLKQIGSQVDRIDSVGICTWGVDFALFDAEGHMLSNPLSYRNTMGERFYGRLSSRQQEVLFQQTGILCDKINSQFLLQGIREEMTSIFSAADKLLMVPDILNYMLTGVMLNEPSELSTTQLMDVQRRRVSPEVCEMLGVSTELFPPLGTHGKAVGMVRPDIRKEIGVDYDIPVVCVPSHDTAAAVTAVPAGDESFAFISSGTWSLIGTELAEPLVNDEVRKAGLTNELGILGTITLLKNSTGMFLLQRLKAEMEVELRQKTTWSAMEEWSRKASGAPPLFDVNNTRFFNPPQMYTAIWNDLVQSGQVCGPLDWSKLLQSVYQSLACSYQIVLEDLERVTQKWFQSVYIVGGGSQNATINQLTADGTKKKIVACHKESTSLGNIASQLLYFYPSLTLSGLRAILARSMVTVTYTPSRTADASLLVNYRRRMME